MSRFFLIFAFCALIFFGSALWLIASLIADERKAATAKRLEALSVPIATKAVVINMEHAPSDPMLMFMPAGMRKGLERRIQSTGNSVSIRTLLIVAAISAAGIAALTMITFSRVTWIAYVAGLFAAFFIPFSVLSVAAARHDKKFLALFPDAIDLIVRAVRAGLPVSGAIDSVGRETPDPVGHEFRTILSDTRIGIEMEEAMRRAARRVNKLEFSFFVATLVLQRETGGNLSETLATLAHVLRRRAELRMKARAMTSEARTSAIVIGALPFFAGAGLAFFSPQYFIVLLHDPRGNWLLAGGLFSLFIGAMTMHFQIKWAMR